MPTIKPARHEEFPGRLPVSILSLVFALGIIAFWAWFFAVENHAPGHSEVYLAFERSFWLPDLLWITPLLAGTALALHRRSHAAIWMGAAAGGALVFLGTLDLSFCVQQHHHYRTPADAVAIGVIACLCIFAGAGLIFFSQRWLQAGYNAVRESSPAPGSGL